MGLKTKSNKAAQRKQVSIILMGGTGTGKTTFTNLAGGSQFTIGEGLESCTQTVQYHRFPFADKDVTLIDVPGFDDTNKSDIDILKIIADFLVKEHQEHRSMNGVLYFHRISDIRMGGAARRNLTMFQKLCGPDAFKNVAIVTTRWDEEEKEIAESRLVELKKKPFKEVLDGGGKIFRHDRSSQSAERIITHLASKDAIPLLIQREIVDEHKELAETAAGEEKDSNMLKDLESECLELRERMAHWEAESEKLANPNTQKLPKTGLQPESSQLQELQARQGEITARPGNGKDVDQPTSSNVPLIAPSTSPQTSTPRAWSSLQALKEHFNAFVGSPSQWFTLMRSACNYLLSFCVTNSTAPQEAQEPPQRVAEEGESGGKIFGRASV